MPDQPLPYVWESCITMGTQWSFKPDDQYKSRGNSSTCSSSRRQGRKPAAQHRPAARRELPPEAVKRLEKIGDWMRSTAEAIHSTRAIEPYKEGRVALTRKGDVVYAIYLLSARRDAAGEDRAEEDSAEGWGERDDTRKRRGVDVEAEGRRAR